MGVDLDEMIDFHNVKSRGLWYFWVYGGDLDEMIDFKSRDLWYFKRNLSELVMYGYKSLRRGELNENDNFD